MLKTILVIIGFTLTFILYILLGIEDFRPNKKQLLALIPLLLLLITLSRMDFKPIPIVETIHRDIKEDIQVKEELVIEEVIQEDIIIEQDQEFKQNRVLVRPPIVEQKETVINVTKESPKESKIELAELKVSPFITLVLSTLLMNPISALQN